MRKRILSFIFLSVIFLGLHFTGNAQQLNQNESLFGPESHSRNPEVGLQLQSSFSTGFGGMNLFSQSVAPHLTWNLGQRWSLTAGTVISTSRMNGMNLFSGPEMQGGQGPVMPARMTGTTFYAFGAYQASERLTLTGGSWVERNHFPEMNIRMNPQAFDMSGRGMMFGMDYRITDNLRFGAEVRLSSGYNPYNPFHQQGSVFHHHRPAGW